MEDNNIYINANGYLVIPEYDINYLISFNESNIPKMPEATEVTAKIAGRDGDIVLATSYEPIAFEIVCYTDDNLTAAEKMTEESKLNALLNSIKKDTRKLIFSAESKFYEVKYAGALIVERFPKHIKFTIPLKASNPFGMALTKGEATGTETFTSNTIKDVGGIFTILGPAESPKLSLNDYQMEYDGTILEGNQLIIDSGNSTVTLISENSETHEIVKTNAMRYYNHQFPKIKNGTNSLVVNSGVSEENVTLEWYDLVL